MHSNRMRTARSLTVSPSICHTYHPTTHTPLPCMHPAKHDPPTMQPCHTHPDLPNMSPLPCNPATHTPTCQTCPPAMQPCHTHRPAMHPPLPCNPATHTDLPHIPPAMQPCHTHRPAMHPPAMHAPCHAHLRHTCPLPHTPLPPTPVDRIVKT